jgi:hypothetical protein
MTAPAGESLADALGPPPFRFQPSPGAVNASAFTNAFKLLAVVIVSAAVAWLWRMWQSGQLGNQAQGTSGVLWFAAATLLMAYSTWHILRSRTTITPDALEQTWVWDKRMELRELAYAKLIRVRGLDSIIAPRLYARTLAGKFTVFYSASPVQLADFERLVRELRIFRGF